MIKNITYIKTILSLSVRDLAQIIGTSRQQITDWMSNTITTTKEYPKLIQLSKASDAIAQSGKSLSPLQLKRALPGGKTIFERIADGGDGREVVNVLLTMLEQESLNRSKLGNTLLGHKYKIFNANISNPHRECSH